MDSSERVGLTNGLGEPKLPVSQVKPGSIARFGTDDDCTVIVLANFAVEGGRELLYYGCFCDSLDAWERDRLFSQVHSSREVLTVIIPA